jgi:hypothetical protein
MRAPSPAGVRQRLLPRFPGQPWHVLWSLALVQWLLLLLLTRRIVHNGRLFLQDASATYFYSTAWSFAHGHLAPALVGYGWPLVTAPVAGITGVNFLDGLPALVLLQVLVLQPIALLAVYGVASRIGGRVLGYLSAAVWACCPTSRTRSSLRVTTRRMFSSSCRRASV